MRWDPLKSLPPFIQPRMFRGSSKYTVSPRPPDFVKRGHFARQSPFYMPRSLSRISLVGSHLPVRHFRRRYNHHITAGKEKQNTTESRRDQSAISVSTRILRIITSKPIVTMMSSVKLNQPMTMALVPTPLLTLPLPKSWAMTDAATDAVCCHNTETRTKMAAMKMMASATCETGRDGNGFTSRSEPSESVSSCHTGKVARRRTQMKAKMMAMMLGRIQLASGTRGEKT